MKFILTKVQKNVYVKISRFIGRCFHSLEDYDDIWLIIFDIRDPVFSVKALLMHIPSGIGKNTMCNVIEKAMGTAVQSFPGNIQLV